MQLSHPPELFPVSPQEGPHSGDIPHNFCPPQVGVRSANSTFLSLLPVSTWFLLYILSRKTSTQLDFRWFRMMALVQLSCNFDVVMG